VFEDVDNEQTKADKLHSTHILVVDDDESVLELLCEALERYGYDVTSAPSAEEASLLIRERRYDLVLCDLYMSGMDGVQLTRAVCMIHPRMPVILMTAFGDIDAGRQALEAGASDFVTKPLEISKLPIVLENNLQRKLIEARRLSEERADVLFKAIKALAAAIDAKSHYTGCHSARMAELCVHMGMEIGLDHNTLNTLELAAHIHDVGKIGTPDAVLMKPGRLSDEEWAHILKHPATGADFLTGIDELREVADVIRHHHEHLDGSGYPDGLRGDAIPLLSRILSVADAFEAMTSDRPYRAAITPNDAVQELRANAGTQFDPAVVEVLANVVARTAGSEVGEDQRAA
jgi:response regulator RpfG family c-di-GMP phosphodiesterase